MKNNYLIIFTVVAVFTGFLLGYSIPPIVEIRYNEVANSLTGEQQDTESESEDLSDYYKQLQELQQ
jgi:hypothetical protein